MTHLNTTDLYNWVYIGVALASLVGGAGWAKRRIGGRISIFVTAMRDARRVARENANLRDGNSELASKLKISETSKNDYKQFCSELDSHLNRISVDLASARKELADFSTIMDTQEKTISSLLADRDLILIWGRTLRNRLESLGVIDIAKEPALLTLTPSIPVTTRKKR